VIKVLVVDDSALMRRVLVQIFNSAGDMEVAVAHDGAAALACLHEVRPDVITLDVNMPRMNGLECLDRIMVERPCPVVMVSSLTEAGADVTLAALQLGAVDFIAKPAGTVSLSVDELAPLLIEKVRTASQARLRQAARLSERVRLRTQAHTHGPNGARRLPTRPPPSGKFAAVPRPGATANRLGLSPYDQDGGVVLIGTSTGGPPALDAVLTSLPGDFPWPIIVAQHMPASFTGPLARRLDRQCQLSVAEVTGPVPLSAGCVYIGRGDADIIVSARPSGPVAMAAPPLAEHRWHPSVDRLVTTAMTHLAPARLVGVLMTGMGNDGAAAMARLHREGGHTIAESEESAVVWGMPGELVRADGADVVAPLDRIAAQLLEWAG
jgi:two-component system chemotaxis response regulator CheB